MKPDELYQLLPAIHRIRDSEGGEPLRALLNVLTEPAHAVEEDLLRLYDNWFIETCEEWVVPYIAELFGVKGLHAIEGGVPYSRRALVANMLGYRRRKGTVAVLEQLAFDTTGWPARAVEFFSLLGTTQNVNHVRPRNVRTPDLRRTAQLEHVGSAFDAVPRTADVRRISTGRGQYNLPHIGISLWRLQSYRLLRASPAPGPTPGAYFIDSLGRDVPCFNPPQTEAGLSQATEEHHVPAPLRRRPLFDELEARRQALASGLEPWFRYFDDRPDGQATPAFQLFLDGQPIPAEQLLICDLSAWTPPPESKSYPHPQPDGTSLPVSLPLAAAVDPELGRLVLAPSRAGATVRFSSAYGFSGDVGAGPYNRRQSLQAVMDRPITWQVGVSQEHPPVAGELFGTLAEAIASWNQQPPGTSGVLILLDSSRYTEELTGPQGIRIPAGSRLIVTAGDWPLLQVPGGLPGEKRRLPGILEPDRRRPHLQGPLSVEGVPSETDHAPGELILDGVLLEGTLTVVQGALGRLRLSHTTGVPSGQGLTVEAGHEHLVVELHRSIVGPIHLMSAVRELHGSDCILQGAPVAIQAPDTPLSLQQCSVIGEVVAGRLEASNCLFTASVMISRRQEGCVRFSYLAPDSQTPRRFHCQPELALAKAPAPLHEAVRARLVPSFTSEQYGHPGFGQLSRTCAEELLLGAEDATEMGAFHLLQQPRRLANLRGILEDYLRFGLEAGFIFRT